MTKITYIHGIPQDELVQRAAEIPQAGTIDYRFLSEGELSATLLLRQLRVLANYYPELSDYRRAEQFGG